MNEQNRILEAATEIHRHRWAYTNFQYDFKTPKGNLPMNQ